MKDEAVKTDVIYDRTANNEDLEGRIFTLFSLARLGICAADTAMNVQPERQLNDLQNLFEHIARELDDIGPEVGELQGKLQRQAREVAA